ncbi:MAG: hypothetical protein KBS62_03465 [Oscillospiraceae bacterium]|nr:hypothetical protein [Candidatus Ruminococcus equi]
MLSYYGNYRTRTFANIFPTFDDFEDFYEECGVPQNLLTGDDYANYGLEAIYFLLISNYANSHIKSADENRFKLKMMSIIYEDAPVWQRLMYLQGKVLSMSDNDLMRGSKAIYNHAQHPETLPSTATLEEITYIDDQNTTNWKKDNLRTYLDAFDNLTYGICDKFVKKFKQLFLTVDYPDAPLLYATDESEV